MLLIALIVLTLLKVAPSDFGSGSKKPQQYLLQLFPSRLPGAALLMELGCPRGDGDKVKAHPDTVPTGAALRFGSQTLKPPCSSKQLWGNKSSWKFLFAFMHSSSRLVFDVIFTAFPLSSNSGWSGMVLGYYGNWSSAVSYKTLTGRIFPPSVFFLCFLQSKCPGWVPHALSEGCWGWKQELSAASLHSPSLPLGGSAFPSAYSSPNPALKKFNQLWTDSSDITLPNMDRRKARETMLKLLFKTKPKQQTNIHTTPPENLRR